MAIWVECNGYKGSFSVEEFKRSSKSQCISCDGKRFSPSAFEAYSGRGSAKKWRTSIKYNGRPIDDYLTSLGIVSGRRQLEGTNEEENRSTVTSRLDMNGQVEPIRGGSTSSTGSPSWRSRPTPSRPTSATSAPKRRKVDRESIRQSRASSSVASDHEEEEEDPFPQDTVRGQHVESSGVGLLQKIVLENFMCHSNLEVELSTNVNFIHGRNGSGKSAILNGIIVGLGGRAKATDRASSVAHFIKHGCNRAKITIWLANRESADSYRYDVYGNTIMVCRTIYSDGTSDYRLKSAAGRIVSDKKEELNNVLSNFGIQVDSPVSLLSQDMSREYLHQQDAKKKYEIYAKATLLEHIDKQLSLAEESQQRHRRKIDQKEKEMQRELQPIKELEDQYRALQLCADSHTKLTRLNVELTWSELRKKEMELDVERQKIAREEDRQAQLQKKVDKCQVLWDQLDSQRAKLQETVDSLKESIQELKEEQSTVLQDKRRKEKAHRGKLLQLHKLRRNATEVQNNIRDFEQKIEDCKRRQRRVEAMNTKHDKVAKQARLKTLKADLEKTSAELKKNRDSFIRIEDRIHEFIKAARASKQMINTFDSDLDRVRRRLRSVEESRDNRLKVFGAWVPQALKEIDRERHRFHHRPIGPLGSLVSVHDQKWAPAVEKVLRREFFSSFLCHNHRDRETLSHILKRVVGSREDLPLLTVTPFRDRVYNYQDYVPKSKYPTMLSMMSVKDPNVLNLLIDLNQVHRILLIENSSEAREYTFFHCPPQVLKSLSLNCSEVFPDGAWYSGKPAEARAFYLQQSHEANLRSLHEEMRSLEESRRQQIHQLKKQEEHCHMQRGEKRVMEGLRQDLIMKKDSTSTEIRRLERDLALAEELEEEEFEEEIGQYQTELDHLTEEEVELQCKTEECKEEEQSTHEEVDQVEEQLEQVNQQLEQLRDNEIAVSEDLREANARVRQAASKKEEHLRKVQQIADSVAVQLSSLEAQEKLFEEAHRQTEEETGEEIVTHRTPNEIRREIKAVKQSVSKEQESLPDIREVRRRLKDKLDWYHKTKQHISESKEFLKASVEGVSMRREVLEHVQQMMSLRISTSFAEKMRARGYHGTIEIDYKLKQLRISAEVERARGVSTDTRTLSGGERSYTTVCFLLSLWTAADSPFRVLDEFDVFMDMISRNISMKELLKEAEKDFCHQYIFLTPLSMSELRARSHSNLRILQLEPPVRGGVGV